MSTRKLSTCSLRFYGHRRLENAPGISRIIEILPRSLAMELELFLSIFSADCPLSVFFYEKLKDILYRLYQSLYNNTNVKPKVLKTNTTVVKMISLI